MRGRDPRIHAVFSPTVCMGCRVKPGNDERIVDTQSG